MKILLVTNELNPHHGYGRFSIDLVNQLKKKYFKYKILVQKNSQNDPKYDVHKVLKHKPSSPMSRPDLLVHDFKVVSKYSRDFDAIHFLTESHLSYASLLQKPYLVTCHGTWAVRPLRANPISRLIFLRSYKRAEQVIAVSSYTAKRLMKEINDLQIKVIANGIDLRISRSTRTPISPFKILSVGSLNTGKDFLTAARSVATLSQTFPVEYNLITGRPNSRIELELKRIANRYKLPITIHKNISDAKKNRLYQESDLFLLTPREVEGDFEGFGLIYLEAAAAGLPIITTKSGAVTELVKDLGSGLLENEGDVKKIAKAMARVLDNKQKYLSLRKNGYQSVQKYTSNAMAENYINIYNIIKQHS